MDTSSETAQVQTGEGQEWTEVYADIEAALADIDPDDREALYARALQILDDIHSDRF